MQQPVQLILQPVHQVFILSLTVSQVELAVIQQQLLLQLLRFQQLQFHMPVLHIVLQELQQLLRLVQQEEHTQLQQEYLLMQVLERLILLPAHQELIQLHIHSRLEHVAILPLP